MAIHANRWYRYGEMYGNRIIVSKIAKQDGTTQTLYLTLCQCGNLIAIPLYNAKNLSNRSMCEECAKNKYGFYTIKMISDEDIYGIFFKSKEEK